MSTLTVAPTVAVQSEGVRVPLARARVATVVQGVLRAETVRSALVSVTFVTTRRMAALHAKHLAHQGPTDVISFGFRDTAGATIGDIYICPAVARTNARAFGRPVREELVRLVVHGTLHVLGYDHPAGEARLTCPMWRRQERYVRRWLAA
ncbi:MAG: rRNA maturation RNase YbeY [Gemmatimonadota bacterium]